MKVDKTNYKEVAPEVLADFIGSGTAQIVEKSVEGLIEIIKYAFQHIGEKKLLKRRVETLETTAKAQAELLTKIVAKVGL